MSRGHHNIFQYFRGPSRVPIADAGVAESPQLEDNTTKALINTLEHCEPGVTERFLQRFTATVGVAGPSLFICRALPSQGRAGQSLLVGNLGIERDAKPSSALQQHAQMSSGSTLSAGPTNAPGSSRPGSQRSAASARPAARPLRTRGVPSATLQLRAEGHGQATVVSAGDLRLRGPHATQRTIRRIVEQAHQRMAHRS
jgi:hypothetical protein